MVLVKGVNGRERAGVAGRGTFGKPSRRSQDKFAKTLDRKAVYQAARLNKNNNLSTHKFIATRGHPFAQQQGPEHYWSSDYLQRGIGRGTPRLFRLARRVVNRPRTWHTVYRQAALRSWQQFPSL
jgi:hypothetical protein